MLFDPLEPLKLPKAEAPPMVPSNATPLEFLRQVYTDASVPLPLRIRAAVEAAPFAHPKLSAIFDVGRAMGRRLEEAIARSEGHLGVTPPQPSEGDQ
jgi:hypothetical protein